MKKTTNEIIAQIRTLLDELEGTPAGTQSVQKDILKQTPKKLAGCIGAIQELINEGFFETQKSVLEVVNKLKEDAQPYGKELVSMNLMNLVKPPRRILRRIDENKQWKYILRK